MGRRNDHTQEQQREMAVTAGELLLVKEGISGFSMRKVAAAIGYTVGNLYLIFKNQDDLLATINERTADAIYAFLRDATEGESNPKKRLLAMSTAYVEFAHRHPNRWRLLFEHQLAEQSPSQDASDARLNRLFELVETNLKELMPKVAPKALRSYSTGLWSSVHGVCTLAVTGKLHWGGSKSYQSLCDLVVQTFLKGLEG